MSFEFKGSKAMQRKLKRIADKTPDRMKAALRIEAELIMAKSKQEHVPVDLGTLRSSGFVNDAERKGKNVSVTMGYGGAASAYALSIHEFPSKHNPPSWEGVDVKFHPEGRGSKFLEKPFFEALEGMDDRIAARLDLEKDKD
jgi:hypothetical protein